MLTSYVNLRLYVSVCRGRGLVIKTRLYYNGYKPKVTQKMHNYCTCCEYTKINIIKTILKDLTSHIRFLVVFGDKMCFAHNASCTVWDTKLYRQCFQLAELQLSRLSACLCPTEIHAHLCWRIRALNNRY